MMKPESHYKRSWNCNYTLSCHLPLATSSAFSHGKQGGRREKLKKIEKSQHNSCSPLFSFMLLVVLLLPRSSSITLSLFLSVLCLYTLLFSSPSTRHSNDLFYFFFIYTHFRRLGGVGLQRGGGGN
jgi:hypothetical protein